jgi:hypothetical protein
MFHFDGGYHASSQRVLIVCLGVVLSVTLFAAGANAAKLRTWNLTKEFAAHKKRNPVHDRYKDPDVWSWMYGEADTPSSYLLMEHLFSPQVIKAKCDVNGFSEWNRSPEFFDLPNVLYNAGPTVARGETSCAPFAEYPTKTFFMHPDNASSLASIVRWKSPVTKIVTVSGSVQPTDSHVEGIVWQLDQGATILLGPTEQANDSRTSFGPMTVSISAGESLYLEIGRGIGGGSYDTTAVTLNIMA